MNLYYLTSIIEWEKVINNNTMKIPISFFVSLIIIGLAIKGIKKLIKK